MRTKLFLITFLFSLFAANSQQNWKWARSAGGLGHDDGAAISNDANGNCYVTGQYQQNSATFGTITLNTGNRDMFVSKYDSTGLIKWANKIASAGGGNPTNGIDIKTDPAGNSYVLGTYQGPTVTVGSFTLSSQNGMLFLAKLDPAGTVLWAKNTGYYQGLGGYSRMALGIDGSGNSYITGDAHSNFAFADTLLVSKYDNTGTLVWKRFAKSSAQQWAEYSIATDLAGNSYVSGLMFGGTTMTLSGAVISNTTNGYCLYVAKYDAGGTLQWAKSAGNYPSLYAPSIAIDGSGNSYVAGHYLGNYAGFGNLTIVNTNTMNQGYDIYLVKFDNTGSIVWAKGAGGSSADQCWGVCTDPAGNVIITGMFWNSCKFGANTAYGLAGPEIFVAKYDGSGTNLWAKSTGGFDVDQGNDVTAGTNYKLWITGRFFSSRVYCGKDTLVNCDTINKPQEILVAMMGSVVSTPTITPPPPPPNGIMEQTVAEHPVIVYPNPVVTTAMIALAPSEIPYEIFLYNNLGQKVRKMNTRGDLLFDREGLALGLYMVEIRLDGMPVKTARLIISD